MVAKHELKEEDGVPCTIYRTAKQIIVGRCRAQGLRINVNTEISDYGLLFTHLQQLLTQCVNTATALGVDAVFTQPFGVNTVFMQCSRNSHPTGIVQKASPRSKLTHSLDSFTCEYCETSNWLVIVCCLCADQIAQKSKYLTFLDISRLQVTFT